jgi:hypothetical protein
VVTEGDAVLDVIRARIAARADRAATARRA